MFDKFCDSCVFYNALRAFSRSSFFQGVAFGEIALVGAITIHPGRSLDFAMLVSS